MAYSFIMQDELYLLDNEKELHALTPPAVPIVSETSEIVLPVIETKPFSFNYYGANNKAFLIVVHYNDAEFMADTHLTALTAVLARLQYTIEDVAIFNLANYMDAAFDALLSYFKPQKLLFLGEKSLPTGLGAISQNKPKKIESIPLLFSFSFDEMMSDNEKKKAFWEQMKQL